MFKAARCWPQWPASGQCFAADTQGGIQLSGAFDRPQPVGDIRCFAGHAGKPADEAGQGADQQQDLQPNGVRLAYLFEAGKSFHTLCVRVTFVLAKVTKTVLAGSRADAIKPHRCPALLANRGGAGTRCAQTPRTFIPVPLRCSARSTARTGQSKSAATAINAVGLAGWGRCVGLSRGTEAGRDAGGWLVYQAALVAGASGVGWVCSSTRGALR